MSTYVVDTNVLLQSPGIFGAFKDDNFIVPYVVLEELDNNKTKHDITGYNARKAIKEIDSFHVNGSSPVKVLILSQDDFERMAGLGLDPYKNDNQIVYTALKIGAPLISNDIACRIKAREFGVKIEDIELSQSYYFGFKELDFSSCEIDAFYEEKELIYQDSDLYENQFLLLRDYINPKHTALAKYQDGKIVNLKFANMRPWDISPRNLEQTFLLEALMDPKIQLVTVSGIAGTGKTLLSLAAGGHMVVDEKRYDKLVYYKTAIGIGPTLGALPGDLEEKLRPFMESAHDAFEYLLDNKENLISLIDHNMIEFSALTFLRGRSLPRLFMVVDEAQNISPQQIKTLISRAGEGTKIVLLGDPCQIDNKALDQNYNGLIHAAERFKGQKIHAHITMYKNERSLLSKLAAELL